MLEYRIARVSIIYRNNIVVSSESFYNKDPLNAFDSIFLAQKIAFGPMVFQAAICLRDFNILSCLDHSKEGCTLSELVKYSELSEYSVSVLLDMGLSSYIVYQQNSKFFLTKTGYFLLHDEMTRINMDFTQYICYEGLFKLKESLKNNSAEGLKALGPWETIYPHLKDLSDVQKKSWFEYDHFYSDASFSSALEYVLKLNPKHIFDIGGNTGKFAQACCERSAELEITIVDLPEQIGLAQENFDKQDAIKERIHFYPVDILSVSILPQGADLYWMSQFLDCFSKEQVIHILKLIKKTKRPAAKVCILDLFWNRQKFEAATFSLNASSLYFTAIANGYSRFYHSDEFKSYIEIAGLKVVEEHDQIGLYHTLLVCE